MERANTRQEILDQAMELFSVLGYEATSVSQIAEAVGIRKASLYNHFASKQEILDTLLKETIEQYEKHSIFAKADWNDSAFTDTIRNMTPDDAVKTIIGQVQYILHDPMIRKGRKLLTIEQFRNKEMADLQTKQNYADVLRYFTGFVRFFMQEGVLVKNDAELLAAQFCLPITVWINLCDREPEREAEVMKLIEKHVLQFFAVYRA